MTQSREDRLKALKAELVGGLLLSPAEVGEILDVHQRTVVDYIHTGRLEAWQLGGSWKVPEEALRRFVVQAKRGGADPDKRSPFEAVRWDGDRYEVTVDEATYTLAAIDGVPISDIVDFAKRAYGDRPVHRFDPATRSLTDEVIGPIWQKRIDEDLIEILKLMGHEPGATATLTVVPTGARTERELRDVAMTFEKRRAIWKRRQAESA
jgi:excisionase family DNA binding protein